jgi:hypothetical protein
MGERKPGREYYLALREVRDRLVWAVARVEALDQELQPEKLAEQGFELGELAHTLDYAVQLADAALSDAQIALTVEGVGFELGDV